MKVEHLKIYLQINYFGVSWINYKILWFDLVKSSFFISFFARRTNNHIYYLHWPTPTIKLSYCKIQINSLGLHFFAAARTRTAQNTKRTFILTIKILPKRAKQLFLSGGQDSKHLFIWHSRFISFGMLITLRENQPSCSWPF